MTVQAIIVDPAVTKSGDPKQAGIGDTVVFTIHVFNNGSQNATNVVVVDTKPEFLDIVSVNVVPAGPTVTINGNTLTVDIGTVTPSDLYTITVETVVNNFGKAPGGSNLVEITSNRDDDMDNNDDQFTMIIPVTALPASGFAEMVGAPCLLPVAVLLIAVILLARGLRKRNELSD